MIQPTESSLVTTSRAYALLALVIVLWGGSWPIMKIGLAFIPPLWFAAFRILTGAACLFIILAPGGRIALPRRGDLPILFSVGILQVAGFMALVNAGLQHVDAGRSAILAYTTPLWVIPMAYAFLGERLTAQKGAGVIVGLLGVGVLFNPLTFDWTPGPVLMGNAMLMAAAILWAITIIHVRGHYWLASPLRLMPWQMALGGLLLVPLALAFEGIPAFEVNTSVLAVIAYTGPISSAFCFWAYITVARALPATNTAMGSLGVPVVGFIASTLFLGETLDSAKIVGLGLISGGVAIASLFGRQRT
ncbi:MAG: DMT family transporter [Rhodospirillales bacterium]|nr:DMT family transporter [Rhodospirillales bacterium]